jgi:hypothetical protein
MLLSNRIINDNKLQKSVFRVFQLFQTLKLGILFIKKCKKKKDQLFFGGGNPWGVFSSCVCSILPLVLFMLVLLKPIN